MIERFFVGQLAHGVIIPKLLDWSPSKFGVAAGVKFGEFDLGLRLMSFMLGIFDLEWSQFKFIFDPNSMKHLALISIYSIKCRCCIVILVIRQS